MRRSPRITHRISLRLLVLMSIVLDAAVIAISFLLNKHSVFLDDRSASGMSMNFQRLLPSVGAFVGHIICFINAMAISKLVITYAKRTIVRTGMTFATMSDLHEVATAQVPRGASVLCLIAILILLSKAFLPSAIVDSVTPDSVSWTAFRQTPLVEFSVASGVQPDIWCEYYDQMATDLNLTSPIGYGYGVNCPIDTDFGEIYNAALRSLQGQWPANSTKNGATFPSDMLGVSGSVATLTKRYVSGLTGKNASRDIIASDTVDVCVSQMVVNVSCARSLGEGQYFNMSYIPVPGGVPQGIVVAALCDPTGCGAPRYAPHFSGGTVTAFWDMDSTTGNTTLSIYSFGTYATDMTSVNIQCKTSAREIVVPVRITGGTDVSLLPSHSCPHRPQPSSQFLLNVTRIADMAFIKMQGPDGKFEPIAYVPSGTDRVDALSLALQRMVATGATEMYSLMDANISSESWGENVPLEYTTTRTRLGTDQKLALLFTIAPLLLLLVVFVGWITMDTSITRHARMDLHSEGVYFNPLSPVCAAVAGMNRKYLPDDIANLHDASTWKIMELPLILKYDFISDNRKGFNPIETGAVRRTRLTSFSDLDQYTKVPLTDEQLKSVRF